MTQVVNLCVVLLQALFLVFARKHHRPLRLPETPKLQLSQLHLGSCSLGNLRCRIPSRCATASSSSGKAKWSIPMNWLARAVKVSMVSCRITIFSFGSGRSSSLILRCAATVCGMCAWLNTDKRPGFISSACFNVSWAKLGSALVGRRSSLGWLNGNPALFGTLNHRDDELFILLTVNQLCTSLLEVLVLMLRRFGFATQVIKHLNSISRGSTSILIQHVCKLNSSRGSASNWRPFEALVKNVGVPPPVKFTLAFSKKHADESHVRSSKYSSACMRVTSNDLVTTTVVTKRDKEWDMYVKERTFLGTEYAMPVMSATVNASWTTRLGMKCGWGRIVILVLNFLIWLNLLIRCYWRADIAVIPIWIRSPRSLKSFYRHLKNIDGLFCHATWQDVSETKIFFQIKTQNC